MLRIYPALAVIVAANLLANGCGSSGSGSSDPQCATSVCKLVPLEPDTEDTFGYSVGIADDIIVVGSAAATGPRNSTGALDIFRLEEGNWETTEHLTASNGNPFDLLGSSVSISGDVVVAGATGRDRPILFDDNIDAGGAYVFRWVGSNWVEEQELIAFDFDGGDFFGVSVAIDGDAIVVGAFADDDLGAASGSAYVYRFDGASWGLEQKLVASDGAFLDFFGSAVAIDGDVIAVSAPNADESVTITDSGAVYVFRFDGATWLEEQVLEVSVPETDELFGNAVAVRSGVIAVGARSTDIPDDGNPDTRETDYGAVYVFRFDGADWVVEQTLTATDGAPEDFFGTAVALDGEVLIVGSPSDDDEGSNSGSAYVFEFDGVRWNQERKISAIDGDNGDQFGVAVALADDTIVVGAPQDEGRDGEISAGSAYTSVR